jgi:DNA-binding FadR family transcriptional regulator
MITGMLRHILHTAATNTTPDPTDHPDTHLTTARDHHQTHHRLVDLITHHEADAAETLWRTHLTDTHQPSPTATLDLLG